MIRAAGWSLALVLLLSGCAARSTSRWDRPVDVGSLPSVGPVFVMEPVVDRTASPGNVGRDFAEIRSTVANRILVVLRERFPRSQIAGRLAPMGARVPAGYPQVMPRGAATAEELNAAIAAHEAGATHLIVPTITEWREMRTDDPIGALTLPHNRISVTMRLMRFAPPAVAGEVTFVNEARVTVNQKAAGLLDERFRQAVLRLISGGK